MPLLIIFKSFKICYTIKANSNPAIIDILKTTIPGLGADCSSRGELFAAKIGGFQLVIVYILVTTNQMMT